MGIPRDIWERMDRDYGDMGAPTAEGEATLPDIVRTCAEWLADGRPLTDEEVAAIKALIAARAPGTQFNWLA